MVLIMKAKAISVYITIMASIISLVAIVVCYLSPDFGIKSMLLNIFYSLFGGAILSFALSISDYFIIKRETINDFYNEYFDFLKVIHNISFVDIGIKEELTAQFIFLESLFEHDEFQRKEFIAKARQKLLLEGIKLSESGTIPFFKLEAPPFKKQLVETMMSYVDVSKYRLNKLWKVSSNIFFLNPWFNKKHKENYQLCEKADELFSLISSKSLHFNMYLKGDFTNTYQMAIFVKELNNKVFKIEKNDNAVRAWEDSFNNLLDSLNKYMNLTLKMKYIKLENKPFYCSIINTPNENK